MTSLSLTAICQVDSCWMSDHFALLFRSMLWWNPYRRVQPAGQHQGNMKATSFFKDSVSQWTLMYGCCSMSYTIVQLNFDYFAILKSFTTFWCWPNISISCNSSCISGILKNKTRLLVTHNLSYLSEVDIMLVMNEVGSGGMSLTHTVLYFNYPRKSYPILVMNKF